MALEAVTYQVLDRTEAEFGEGINPHLFRSIAATTIASVTPDNVTDVAGVLGHASLAVSEKYYTKARTVEAGRAYHGTISTLRRRQTRRRGQEIIQ
jgi:integrase